MQTRDEPRPVPSLFRRRDLQLREVTTHGGRRRTEVAEVEVALGGWRISGDHRQNFLKAKALWCPTLVMALTRESSGAGLSSLLSTSSRCRLSMSRLRCSRIGCGRALPSDTVTMPVRTCNRESKPSGKTRLYLLVVSTNIIIIFICEGIFSWSKLARELVAPQASDHCNVETWTAVIG